MSEEKYSDYLKSDHWQECRNKRLKIDFYQCFFCGCKDNLNVHHLTYENKGNEDVQNDLVTLCKSCHSKIHFLFDKTELKPKSEIIDFDKEFKKLMNKRYAFNGNHFGSLSYETRDLLTVFTGDDFADNFVFLFNVATENNFVSDEAKTVFNSMYDLWNLNKLTLNDLITLLAPKDPMLTSKIMEFRKYLKKAPNSKTVIENRVDRNSKLNSYELDKEDLNYWGKYEYQN